MSNSESTSVAVEILEDLCRKGSLTEEEKEKYKNEYDKLHRAVAERYYEGGAVVIIFFALLYIDFDDCP